MRAPTLLTTFGHSLLAASMATLVMSGFMGLLAIAMNAPELHIAHMLRVILLGPAVLAWGVYLAIGVLLLGPLYIMFNQALPGAAHVRGMLFALLPYTLLSLVVMPFGGVMFFALDHGVTGFIGMLALHLAYGATLGTVFTALQTQVHTPVHTPAGARPLIHRPLMAGEARAAIPARRKRRMVTA